MMNAETEFLCFIRKKLIPKKESRHPNWKREKFITSLDGEAVRKRLQKVSSLCLGFPIVGLHAENFGKSVDKPSTSYVCTG